MRGKSPFYLYLNDNPADGTDVSWIWDSDVEVINDIKNLKSIHCSGIRAHDIALRIKYTDFQREIVEIDVDMESSIETVLDEDIEIVYILPTYTAVFQTRDIVMGHLNHKDARIVRIRELIKSKLGA